MDKRKRVVITGLGVVSAVGNNCEEFWASLRAARSGIRPIRRESEEWPPEHNGEPAAWLGAEVRDFQLGNFGPGLTAETMDRFAQFALVAASEAWRDAGAGFLERHRAGAAIILGTAVGGDEARNSASYRVYEKKLRPSPLAILKAMANAAVGVVSMATGIHGPAFAVSSACSSAGHAIGQAFNMIQRGEVEAALTGGSETLPSYSLYKSWEQLRVLSPDGCRPFSRDRNGLVLGEGAGVLILESLDSALSRGARVYAELIGFGMSADAFDLVRPSSEGMARSISNALAHARLSPQEVNYVNAHGTGTVANDQTETAALHLAFGKHAHALAVSSTKAMHGHTLGAAGALELIATVGAVRDDLVPPTINYSEPDPACDLDFVPNTARAMPVHVGLSSSFAFGGLNATLLLRKFA